MAQDTKLSFFRSMRGKLLILFLLLSLIPLAAVGVLSYIQAQDALRAASSDQLQAVLAIKKAWLDDFIAEAYDDTSTLANTANALRQRGFAALEGVTALKAAEIERAFEEWASDVTDLSDNAEVVAGVQALSTGMAELGASQVRVLYRGQASLADAGDGSAYSTAHVTYHPLFTRYLQIHGYPNLILIDMAGDVVYTAGKGDDFATNMNSAAVAHANLADLYRNLVGAGDDETYFADLVVHDDRAAVTMYAGSPIYDGTTQVGILAFQIPLDALNTVVQDRTGLGVTGETYLVGLGPDGVASYRSDRVVKEGQAGDPRSDGYVDVVLAGGSGSDFKIGSTGALEFITYRPLDIPGLDWGIVTTMAVEEVVIPTLAGEEVDFLTMFAATYGYADILLIDPSGYVFYSVAREADYQTNLLDGPYSDSNLGQLVRQVIETEQYGLSDFAMYAPSGAPAAFAAMPVILDGEIEFIAAIQFPFEHVDAIMQERTGMGQTGESYLVGADYRMRSDSYLNPTTHSVAASLAGTVAENGAQTTSVQHALAGESGVDDQAVDYRGSAVLSAYTPLTFGDTTWAMIAEIDTDEAFAAANQLRNILLIVAGVALAGVILVALWIATSLSRPVVQVTEVAQAVSAGNLNVEARVKSSDETGLLANAFNQMIVRLREMLRTEQEQRQYLESTVQKYVDYTQSVARGNLIARMDLSGNGRRNENDPLIILGMQLNETTASIQRMLLQIREAANNLSSAAAEILAATTQQASGSAEQSAGISQTTTTVDEVRTISEQAIERAQEVVDTSQRTVEVSRTGRTAVEETIDSMSQIKERVEGIAENILSLSDQTQQIGDIIATVNEISSQSNMLALNASVEAARAGEYGKGFAVVAAEVRSLAEQSKQATTQVKTILLDIQNAINATVMATEEGTKVVDQGVRLAAQTRMAIEKLADVINETAQIVMQVSAGGQQQASGVEQIALAMQNINQATIQGLASTRQAEKAAQNLNDLARSLNEMVGQYQL